MAVLERQMPNTLNQSIPNNQPNISNNLHNNSPPSQVGRCKAITASGSQCNRNADAGSEYCWQHKKKYDNPENVKSGNQAPVNNNSNYNGHEIQTGPRGGKYYINSNGKKTYIRK
ncbi:MAG: hypothetical protein HXX13_18155 [Bacteroidetes bacterium]|nr:hypothetical protein [Bacteroidota bacterium]